MKKHLTWSAQHLITLEGDERWEQTYGDGGTYLVDTVKQVFGPTEPEEGTLICHGIKQKKDGTYGGTRAKLTLGLEQLPEAVLEALYDGVTLTPQGS